MESGNDAWVTLITDDREDRYRVYLSLFQKENLNQTSSEILHLHPDERRYLDSLQFERRIQSYLSGRMAAKQAVSRSISEDRLSSICIDQGIFHHPVVVHPRKGNCQVSITHCGQLAAAIAHTDYTPMGIDIEAVDERLQSLLERHMTALETELIHSADSDHSKLFTVLWTAKEALSKALRTGFTVPLQVLELKQMKVQEGWIVSEFSNFPQYKVCSLLLNNKVCSIVYPVQMRLQLESIERLFADARSINT
jgi:phosphopantetheinyl transferase